MWRPIGLVLHERWSTEVTCESGPVRAVVRVSRLRVGVDFTMVAPSDTAHLTLAMAHRLAASALEQVAASEGWFVADPTVREVSGGARAVITGGQASAAAMTFFGADVAAAMHRFRRERKSMWTSQLAFGTVAP